MNSIKNNSPEDLKLYLQASGKELCKSEKLKILKDLTDNNCSIDFSGGNPILCKEDREIITEASKLLSCEKISVSIPGCDLTYDRINTLKGVGKIHITMDDLPHNSKNNSRPFGFNELAAKTIEKYMAFGKDIRVVTVLKRDSSYSSLSNIYEYLCKIGVKEWQLLRFYPVGRAADKWSDTIGAEQQQSLINFLKTLRGLTELKFQHSFKGIFEKITCPAIKESIGILPNGNVVACPWGLNSNGEPIDENFVLGKIPEQKIADILASERALIWRKNENVCKTFDFLNKRLI